MFCENCAGQIRLGLAGCFLRRWFTKTTHLSNPTPTSRVDLRPGLALQAGKGNLS